MEVLIERPAAAHCDHPALRCATYARGRDRQGSDLRFIDELKKELKGLGGAAAAATLHELGGGQRLSARRA